MSKSHRINGLAPPPIPSTRNPGCATVYLPGYLIFVLTLQIALMAIIMREGAFPMNTVNIEQWNFPVKFKGINYSKSEDDILITKYGIPVKHKFNVKSGDILVFHHIQKTGLFIYSY